MCPAAACTQGECCAPVGTCETSVCGSAWGLSISTFLYAQAQFTQDECGFKYSSCETTDCSEEIVLMRDLTDDCGSAPCTQNQCCDPKEYCDKL